MCLSKIDYLNCDPKDEDWKIGWKVIEITSDNKKIGPYRCHTYKDSNVIKDELFITSGFPVRSAYRSGFHIWKYIEDARACYSFINGCCVDTIAKLCKIKYRKVCAVGKAGTAIDKIGNCVVALEMQFVEE